ncbi:hypothetical protein [Bacillus phage vB_BanS-Thrax3]|nr:hypothetical protein [Bacillus phage vB_BanS-Thrax1]UUV46578.1 hypothetical protein [Bacillus phage vB_BanS-Thrax3]
MELFSKEELLSFNEFLLGRGKPTQDDGVGYNKGDYGACKTYYNGLSNAQYADLAKRLVKYSATQLNVDKEKMKLTALKLGEIGNTNNRSLGVSVAIVEEETLISFRFNEKFISVLKNLPTRRYIKEYQCWAVPTYKAVSALKALETVGADVKNAIAYVESHKK